MKADNVPSDWRILKLREISEIVSGSTPKTNIPEFWNGDIVWLTPDDLSNSTGLFMRDSSRKITKKGLRSCSAKLLPPNSVVLSSRAPIGYVKVVKVEFATNQGCKSIKYNGSFDPTFLAYSLIMRINELVKYGSGTTFQEISKSNLEIVEVPFPPLPEQRKIAEILETVDRAIEKTDAIIEKYKRIKQGLMQDLLTRGIDEGGKIRSEETHRFKDSPLGRIPEEWEVVSVYDIADIINGGTPNTSVPEYWNGKIPWLSVEDFNTGKRWVFESTKYITELGLKKSSTRLLKKGMLIISARGTVGALAQLGRDMAFNQTSYGLNSKDKKRLSNDFLYFALKHYVTLFLSLAYGNVFDTITRDTFKDILIPLPPLPEQKRIAEVLSQIDAVIEKEEKYKEKLERLKRGLMEDLLTGRVRVTQLLNEEVG